jgi:hypothetical protein
VKHRLRTGTLLLATAALLAGPIAGQAEAKHGKSQKSAVKKSAVKKSKRALPKTQQKNLATKLSTSLRPVQHLTSISSSLAEFPIGRPNGITGLSVKVSLDRKAYAPVARVALQVAPGYRVTSVRGTGIQMAPGAQIRVEVAPSPGAKGGTTTRTVSLDRLQFKEGQQHVPVTGANAASFGRVSFYSAYPLH